MLSPSASAHAASSSGTHLHLLPPPFVLFIHTTTAAATSTTATVAAASAPHTATTTRSGETAAIRVPLDCTSNSPYGGCDSGRNCGGHGHILRHRFIRNLNDRSQLAHVSTSSTASASINVDLCLI
jgi:hypothetical protein